MALPNYPHNANYGSCCYRRRICLEQREGYFVSLARFFDMEKMAGEAALASQDSMGGAWFTYSAPAIEQGVRTSGSLRDFSECEEKYWSLCKGFLRSTSIKMRADIIATQ